ncbi:hypothetical protein [Rhizobium leguminosarum]|uniref:hypothetical protein n=1 Tax=Rhizobium leguminosarum TaxID=384 RepID=UPI001AE14739|nr:hypothetical protein [Rhizobium leguminosarum]MBP2442855.1 hypothetical protein [Rhizobium leguminosarum]
MTTDKRTDLHRAKVGVSILATCIVQTMNESDPTFTNRFLQRLGDAYSELKNNTDGDVTEQMELLTWTRSFLTGFDHLRGQGKPFLSE